MLGSLVYEASILNVVEYKPVKDVKLKLKLKVGLQTHTEHLTEVDLKKKKEKINL
ncbi:hypothetical protein GIB67_022015, partial [Kingdonia uniflora]